MSLSPVLPALRFGGVDWSRSRGSVVGGRCQHEGGKSGQQAVRTRLREASAPSHSKRLLCSSTNRAAAAGDPALQWRARVCCVICEGGPVQSRFGGLCLSAEKSGCECDCNSTTCRQGRGASPERIPCQPWARMWLSVRAVQVAARKLSVECFGLLCTVRRLSACQVLKKRLGFDVGKLRSRSGDCIK